MPLQLSDADQAIRKQILNAPLFSTFVLLAAAAHTQQRDVINPVSEILPYLFLGNQDYAISQLEDHQENKFDIVLSIGSLYFFNPTSKNGIKHIHLAKNTGDSANDWDNLVPCFDEAHKIIKNAKEQGKKVFLHCQAGISRSSTIVLYHLMIEYGLGLKECMSYVQQCRKCIFPNVHFRLGLYLFQQNKQNNKGLPSQEEIMKIMDCNEQCSKLSQDEPCIFIADNQKKLVCNYSNLSHSIRTKLSESSCLQELGNSVNTLRNNTPDYTEADDQQFLGQTLAKMFDLRIAPTLK